MSRDHVEDLDIGGKIMLKLVLKKLDGRASMGWIKLVLDRGKCKAFVNR